MPVMKTVVDDWEQLHRVESSGVKPRLEKALSDITAPIDQNRLEQELIYYIEKYDITEEIVTTRLTTSARVRLSTK